MIQSALNSYGLAWVFRSQGSQLDSYAKLCQGIMDCLEWLVQAGGWSGYLTTLLLMTTGTREIVVIGKSRCSIPTIFFNLQENYFNNAFNSILLHLIPRGRWNPPLSHLDSASPHACQHLLFAIFIFVVIHVGVHTLLFEIELIPRLLWESNNLADKIFGIL